MKETQMLSEMPQVHAANLVVNSGNIEYGFESITDYIHYKVCMKLLIHHQTSTVAQLKFGNGLVNSSHTLLGVWLLIHAEIKVNMC